MRIAHIASEGLPYSKSGGLADVVYSLTKQLKSLRQDARMFLPYYKCVEKKGFRPRYVGSFPVYMSWRIQMAEIFEFEEKGVKCYLIGNPYYFARDNLYGYQDDGERFAFFAQAALYALKYLDWQPDIINVHDWQTAIIPTLIAELHHADPFYNGIGTVLTIHNPFFKGYLDRFFLNDFFNLPDYLYDIGKVRLDGMVSTLKAGIVEADRIVTVSPTHRNELLDENSGHGLAGVLALRSDDFVGILNGIDYGEWNPLTDKHLAKRFSKRNLVNAHYLNQADLLRRFGIHWFGGPVYGMVSRLSFQKGVGLVVDSMRKALGEGASFVVLGSGEWELEKELENLRAEFPDTMGIYIGYSDELAHKIYAGSDFFLVPSLFEPCGLSQMVAQRYGSLPIGRATGGLADTIVSLDLEPKVGNGLLFNDYNSNGLDYAIGKSRELFNDQGAYFEALKRAMGLNRSWRGSASAYLKLYKTLKK